MPTLATTRYVEVGVYIGQFFLPGGGTLPNEVRVPCLVAKGDRLFVVKNTPVRKSFRFGEPLDFTSLSPYLADLDYNANGAKSSPVRLYTSDGNLITENKWDFVLNLGVYDQIQVKDSEFDPTTQYYLDYQTTARDISDLIPVVSINSLSVTAEVRQLTAVGSFPDQQGFEEYVDFFDEFEVDSYSANAGNTHLTRSFSTVNNSAAAGTGTVVVNSSASFSHPYSRVYRIEVTAAAGVSPTRTATLAWNAIPVSGGNSALPPTPLNSVQTKPTVALVEATPLSLTAQLLELGVVLDFTFGASNYNIGDIFYLQANGAGLVEIDALLNNTNQFTEISDVTDAPQVGSTGSVTISSLPSGYTFTDYNTKFRTEVVSVSGLFGSRVATFVWNMYGMHTAAGSFTVSELVTGSEVQTLGATGIDVTLDFGGTHFVVDDQFDWTVTAPRTFYKGKESIRNITLAIATVTPTANAAAYTGGFMTDTSEGRFGTWTAATGSNNARGEIPDGVRFYVRNTYLSALVNSTPGGSRTVIGDQYVTQGRSLGLINFSLQREVTDVFSNPAEISTDTAGSVTGVVGEKYLSLQNLPSSIIRLERVSDDTEVAYTQVSGTPFLRITEAGFSTSTGDLRVTYRWNGPEPEPGQIYYVSGKYLRPPEMYDRPFLFLTPDDATKFLAPSTLRNDAYIGAGICFDYAIPGLFVIQVKDTDEDGVYSKDDYKRAITAFLEDARATDLVVLNNFGSLGDQLNVIGRSNDPFERHESMTFIGAPIGTPIGSEQEGGSLVFYSRNTLQVYGSDPAHGSRTLVGSTKAIREITLEDGSSASVTLDGSFVAAALASLMCSFADPRDTVLRKTLTSFTSMETYRKEENAILGSNNVIFFKDEGSGVFRIMEDITTDPFSPDTLNLNQMVQKQFVTKTVRRALDQSVIGSVFPSASTGIVTIQDLTTRTLQSLVSRSLIGQYQDDGGNIRSISSADVRVEQDPADPTLYHLKYNYFLATVVKRIFGLYTVQLPGGFPG